MVRFSSNLQGSVEGGLSCSGRTGQGLGMINPLMKVRQLGGRETGDSALFFHADSLLLLLLPSVLSEPSYGVVIIVGERSGAVLSRATVS